jgi:hypothetical protein
MGKLNVVMSGDYLDLARQSDYAISKRQRSQIAGYRVPGPNLAMDIKPLKNQTK